MTRRSRCSGSGGPLRVPLGSRGSGRIAGMSWLSRTASRACAALAAASTAFAATACDASPAPSVDAGPSSPRPVDRATSTAPSEGHAQMLVLLREIRERAPRDNLYQHDARVEEL